MGDAVGILWIGDKGSGKNTVATALAQCLDQNFPWMVPDKRLIANFHIQDGYGGEFPYVEEALRWIAMKIIAETRMIKQGICPRDGLPPGPNHRLKYTYAEVIADEASISEELESRGSGTRFAASVPRTQIIALSRKANTTLHLISQLSSQLDRRAQWGSNFTVLARAYWEEENPHYPSYFDYQVNDENLYPLGNFEIPGDFAMQYIFPRYDTYEMPNFYELESDWKAAFDIRDKELDMLFPPPPKVVA